jgi:hypothetical protein
MKCEELQNLITLTGDDLLESSEQQRLDKHFTACPLCRQERDDLRSLTRELRMLRRPVLPAGAVSTLRSNIFRKLGGTVPGLWLIEDRRSWANAWLMPSSVGVFTSVIVAAAFVWLLSISPGSNARKPDEVASLYNPNYLRTSRRSEMGDYAISRQDVSIDSPSVNPRGALVALTNSLIRGEMRDDEVVVVAEVFGNGLARIDEVIEPSRNRRAVGELEKALESDPAFAPFVPADLDKRPQSVRVVLKIQNVDVRTRPRGRR